MMIMIKYRRIRIGWYSAIQLKRILGEPHYVLMLCRQIGPLTQLAPVTGMHWASSSPMHRAGAPEIIRPAENFPASQATEAGIYPPLPAV
jgi:hypothetical protein